MAKELRSGGRLHAPAFASIRAREPPTPRPPATVVTASQRARAPATGSLTHLYARLSRVGAEMGPTFWKLQKCAAFRRMHRYQLHVAPAVAFSFCFENGAPAAKWKMGAYGEKRRYQQHLEWSLSMTENDAKALPCNRGRPVYGDPLPVCLWHGTGLR